MIKYILSFLLILLPVIVEACPGCAGSVNNKADNYTVYILMGFIALVYIPFFMLYRLFFKYKNFNSIEEHNDWFENHHI